MRLEYQCDWESLWLQYGSQTSEYKPWGKCIVGSRGASWGSSRLRPGTVPPFRHASTVPDASGTRQTLACRRTSCHSVGERPCLTSASFRSAIFRRGAFPHWTSQSQSYGRRGQELEDAGRLPIQAGMHLRSGPVLPQVSWVQIYKVSVTRHRLLCFSFGAPSFNQLHGLQCRRSRLQYVKGLMRRSLLGRLTLIPALQLSNSRTVVACACAIYYWEFLNTWTQETRLIWRGSEWGLVKVCYLINRYAALIAMTMFLVRSPVRPVQMTEAFVEPAVSILTADASTVSV